MNKEDFEIYESFFNIKKLNLPKPTGIAKVDGKRLPYWQIDSCQVVMDKNNIFRIFKDQNEYRIPVDFRVNYATNFNDLIRLIHTNVNRDDGFGLFAKTNIIENIELEEGSNMELEAENTIEEAFEPWKAEAWFNGERNENVARMSAQTMLDYNNYLDNKAYQYLRSNDINNSRKCLRLMQQILAASRNRFGADDGATVRIRNVVLHRQDEIARGDQIRDLNNQNNNEPQFGLFSQIRNRNESLENTNLEEEVEIHDTLNPVIWNDDQTLKPEVEEKIKNIVKIFVDILTESKVKIIVKDIYIVGSNANYNYNEASDLDVHIIADESFDCDDKHLPLLYNAYKTLFNRKYDISFKGINVELYVESEQDLSNASTAIYSLENGWIKKPDKNNIPEIDQEEVGKGVAEWTKKYEELLANPSVDEIDDYIDGLYKLRIDSFKEDGEFATGNLIFKEIRRAGILDELKELKAELESKDMSLESLDEDLLLISDLKDGFNKLENCKKALQNVEDKYTEESLKMLFTTLLSQTYFKAIEKADEEKWKEYSNWFKSIYPEVEY